MRFSASNLFLLAGIVIAIAVVVLRTDAAQRSASDDAAAQQAANGQMIQSGLNYIKAGELYVAGGERIQVFRWDQARAKVEQAIANLGEQVEGNEKMVSSYERAVSGLRELQTLSGLAVEQRRIGGGSGTTEQLESRLNSFDGVAAASAELSNEIESERREAQRVAGRVSMVAVVVLGGLIVALGLSARRDDRRRRREGRYSEGLQTARSEQEAYALVCEHLEREVGGSEVAVLNRNNSADRLELRTGVGSDGGLAGAVEQARPDDCLAIRSAKPSTGGTGSDDLLHCEICGADRKNSLCVPSVVGGEVIGSVLLRREKRFDDRTERTVNQAVAEAAPTVAHLRSLAVAERRAMSDALTGLANKRSAEDVSRRMVARASQAGEPLALISFDLDRFKRVNDTYGHPKGDEVLAAVGAATLAHIREDDYAARYGGEEFMVLAPGTTREGGRLLAEKLREAIAALRVPGAEGGITASFGVAALHEDAVSRDELLRRADRALYAAKRGGRNQVVTATEAGISEPEDPVTAANGAAGVAEEAGLE